MKEGKIDKTDLIIKWTVALFIYFTFIFGNFQFHSVMEKILISFLVFANLLTVIFVSVEYNLNKNK